MNVAGAVAISFLIMLSGHATIFVCSRRRR